MNKSFKALYKMRYLPLLLVPLLVAMMVLPGTLMAAESTVNLGTAGSFAVLAGSAVNDTNISSITGDVGLSPAGWGGSALTQAEVTGTIYSVDASGPAGRITNPGLLTTAKNNLTAAYVDAAGRAPTVPTDDYTGLGLGGKTLSPGVYNASAIMGLTGTLTLDFTSDPNGVFIFQAGTELITASGATVAITGGGSACNVFWQVGSSATLGTGTTFVGTIMADQSITDDGGSTVDGRLLARIAAVTLNNTRFNFTPCFTILPPTYPPAASGGILTIYKVDSSGKPIVAYTSLLAASFNIYANAADIGVKPPVQAGSIIKDTNFFRTNLQNGTYYVAETSAPEGYSIDGTARTVTISGGDATVTFVNGPTGRAAASATGTTTEVAAAETTAAPATTAPPATVTTTVTGGQIPKTSTPWYNVLLAGIILILIGAVVWITRKVYEKRSKT